MATQSYNAIAALPAWHDGITDWKANPAWLSIPEHIKLHYSYEDSPVCVPDGTPPVPMDTTRLVPSTRPGTRAPHAWLADGSSTLDLFGDGFVLLRLGANPPDATHLIDAAKAQNVPMRAVTLLDELFSSFDDLAVAHGLEKIRTVGDSFMAVAGAPDARPAEGYRRAATSRAPSPESSPDRPSRRSPAVRRCCRWPHLSR